MAQEILNGLRCNSRSRVAAGGLSHICEETLGPVKICKFRLSCLQDGTNQVRIGKRTIAERVGTNAQGSQISYYQVSKVLKNLESKGCIVIGDIVRDGTMYTVIQPCDIPLVKEKIAGTAPIDQEEDFFTNQFMSYQ